MSHHHVSSPFDARAFRNALGSFATGIAVVTALGREGQPVGLTVNSFNSVSLDPPLIVWSLANHLPVRAEFEACEHYAVNILAEDQQWLSQRFAGRDVDKFAGVAVEAGLSGVPLLLGTCAHFECRNTVRHPGGDHLVFISEVLRFDRDDDRDPLLFHCGAYRRLAAP
jgi:flavin reductase (DIM6/NTAB) family NADH-FMN oxidoreductase RutF